jgi:rubrerythrin
MTDHTEKTLEMFCTTIEMKEKKKALYEDAMKACPDQVGIETFRMLMEAEDEHLKSIQGVYEELKQGKDWVLACKFHEFESEDRQTLLRKIAEEHGKMPRACVDDVVAIETGLKLENASIQFFTNRRKEATDPVEIEFVERMITEEREHYILLADLKFYYVDPEAWFMEKGRARLDGAGGSS